MSVCFHQLVFCNQVVYVTNSYCSLSETVSNMSNEGEKEDIIRKCLIFVSDQKKIIEKLKVELQKSETESKHRGKVIAEVICS